MKKIFIFQSGKDRDYGRELLCAFEKCARQSLRLSLNKLTVDFLISHSIEVLISNGLPKEWYFILKGLNIVTITIDDLGQYSDLADIVIDYKCQDNNRYFTGPNYSVCQNSGMEFEEISDLITKLEWDSTFWGFPVAYLSSRSLTENIMHRVDQVVKRDSLCLIEYLCNCHDNRSVKIAEKNGFHFTDIRLSFEKKLDKDMQCIVSEKVVFAKAKKKDIPVLKQISGDLYKDSRYFFDDNFERNKVKEFYQRWIERAVLGLFDDECFCLYDGALPIGFCSIKYNLSSRTAQIGLFGLAYQYQGRGLGRVLLSRVFSVLINKGISRVQVVTQGRNYAAQRLYQNAGFLTKASELWYHKWL
ncbi:MAG: GNAT family N-acetyltransferase [Candidatus Omnitrophota bacterium]